MKFTKGDIVIIPVPFTDNVRYKLRPAVVISNEKVHSTGDVIIVQITTKQKYDGLSFEISPEDLSENLPAKSFIRIHKIFVLENQIIKGTVSKLSTPAYNKLIKRIIETIS